MGLAKKLLNTPDVDIAELTGSGSVKGLADQAFYSDVMPSWVLKGDVLVEVISPVWPHDKTSRTFMSVAKSALPNLQTRARRSPWLGRVVHGSGLWHDTTA